MANPTLTSTQNMLDYDNMHLEVDGVIVNSKQVITTQQANVADAVVAHSITDTATQLDAANETELEGFYDALGVKVNAILAILEAHGLMADA